MTFEPQQEDLFQSIAGQLMPSSEAHLASHQVAQEDGSVPPTIGGSGLSLCAWCLKSVPCMCWQRILAESFLYSLKEYGLINGLHLDLRVSGTRSNRCCLVLEASGRRTNGSESGSWPTPTVSGNHNCKGASKTSGDGLAIATKKWRTPVADDCNARTGAHNDRGELKLSGQVQQYGQWDKDLTNGNGKSRDSLQLNPRWELQLMGMPADWLDGVEVP